MNIITNIDEQSKGNIIVTVLDYGPMIKKAYTLSELNTLIKTLQHKKKFIFGVAYTKTLGIYSLTSYDIETHISESEMQEYINENNIRNKCTEMHLGNTYLTLEEQKTIVLR